MLSSPAVEMTAGLSTEVEVVGEKERVETAESIETAVLAAVHALGAHPVRIEIASELPAHVGFGSRTATTLAALSLVARLNRLDAPPQELAQLSGRGRVSGTGVHGFFLGGWVIDAGQPPGGDAAPSRFSQQTDPSLLAGHIAPPAWPVGLFLVDGNVMSGHDEAEFFRANAQHAALDADRCVSLAHHKLVPGLLTSDEQLFGEGVRDLHECGFKALEVENQPAAVSDLMEDLRRRSPIVGMSSMGPLVYAMGGKADDWIAIAGRHGAWHLRTSVSSGPAEFTWLS